MRVTGVTSNNPKNGGTMQMRVTHGFLYLCEQCGAWQVSDGLLEVFGSLTRQPEPDGLCDVACSSSNCTGTVRVVRADERLQVRIDADGETVSA